MNPDRLLIAGAVIAAILIAWRTWYMHDVAKGIAEEWLHANRYKAISVKTGLFGGFRFGPRMFRNEERSTHFRCVVEDTRLGGRGVVWLRVWTDRLGLIAREPDVNWETHPHTLDAAGFLPVEDRLEVAQRALLKRIARGETQFAAPSHPRADDEPFDTIVEHLKAMQERRLIAISTPQRSSTAGSMYELVEFAELTEEGRAYLASFS